MWASDVGQALLIIFALAMMVALGISIGMFFRAVEAWWRER